MGQKFSNFVVSKDVFGHPIRVNYKGRNTFQTKLGAFCTLITALLMLVSILR